MSEDDDDFVIARYAPIPATVAALQPPSLNKTSTPLDSLPKSFRLDHDGVKATVEFIDLPEVYDDEGAHIASSIGPQTFGGGDARGVLAPPLVGRASDGSLVDTAVLIKDLQDKVLPAQPPSLWSLGSLRILGLALWVSGVCTCLSCT